MSQTLKVLAAVTFVAVLGWVLLQPVFDAVDIDADEPDVEVTATPLESPEPLPSDEPSPEPSPSDEESAGLPEEFRTRPFFDSYPERCLRPGAPSGDLVLVDRGNRVAAGPLRGPLEEWEGSRIFGVSAFDGWAAWAGQERGASVARPGIHDTIDLLRAERAVAWSPTSPCGLALREDGRLSVIHEDATLVRDGVGTVAFSLDGRKLAMVTVEDHATSIWVATLTGDRMREVLRERAGAPVRLLGWSPNGKAVFFIKGDGGLSFVSTGTPPQSAQVSTRPVEELEPCGDRLLAILGDRIAEISIRGPEFLTEGGTGYRYISCSPAGNFIAAIGDEGLVLLDGEGAFLRDLTQDSGYSDVFVDWGAPGRGLLFGRVRSEGSPVAAELWYISEGGTPIPTGVTYRGGPRAVDWSGTPPTGLP